MPRRTIAEYTRLERARTALRRVKAKRAARVWLRDPGAGEATPLVIAGLRLLVEGPIAESMDLQECGCNLDTRCGCSDFEEA